MNYRNASAASRRRIIVGFVAVVVFFVFLRSLTSSESPSLPSDNVVAFPPAIVRNSYYDGTTHLIIVPCHGTYSGLDYAQWKGEENWALEPYFRGTNGAFVQAMVDHIRGGVQILASEGTRALLIFSGGQTRTQAGPRSEATSYHNVAEANGFFGFFDKDAEKEEVSPPPSPVSPRGVVEERVPAFRRHPLYRRVFSEEFARDSYENIIFSICRFHEIVGAYPKEISVVGFEYKRRRFVEFHRAALRFPPNQFHYIGIDMAATAKRTHLSDEHNLAVAGEDPYFCSAHRKARLARNPMRRTIPYYGQEACPSLRGFLSYCGTEIYKGPLPW